MTKIQDSGSPRCELTAVETSRFIPREKSADLSVPLLIGGIVDTKDLTSAQPYEVRAAIEAAPTNMPTLVKGAAD